MRFFNCLAGALVACAVQPSNADVQHGLSWLELAANPDGSITGDTGLARSTQSTAAALNVLAPGEVADAGIAFLLAQQSPDIETLALRSQYLSGSQSAALLGSLNSRQNADGGFGAFAGHASSVVETCDALRAYKTDETTSSTNISQALQYLVDSQHSDGYWSHDGTSSSIFLTSTALEAVWAYRHSFALTPVIDLAAQWLLDQRDVDQLWPTALDSAKALASLAAVLADRSSIQASLIELEKSQLENGSFAGDAYITALALQALLALEMPHPDSILLNGRVVDGDTQTPLSDALISIEGAETAVLTTDTDGEFDFATMTPGNYQIAVTREPFQPVTVNSDLKPGQSINLGDVPMIRSSTPNHAILRGRVIDEPTNVGIAGAVIRVNQHDKSATTDAAGNYEIIGLPNGPATITASATGYLGAQANANFQDGHILAYSPALKSEDSQFVRVIGAVTSDSGQPIFQATVSVSYGTTTIESSTDAAGQYLVPNLPPGALRVSIQAPGFLTVTGDIEVAAGTTVNFSPAMTPESDAPAPTMPGSIRGIILDAESAQPITTTPYAYFQRQFDYKFAVFGESGEFIIEGAAGSGTFVAGATQGYDGITIPITIPADSQLDLGVIQFKPSGSSENSNSVTGTIRDGVSGDPVDGVTVRVNIGSEWGTQLSSSGPDSSYFFFNLQETGTGTIEFSKKGFRVASIDFTAMAGETADVGTIFLRPENSARLGDLIVRIADSAGLASDPAGYQLTGSLSVEIKNQGGATISGATEILAFYDANRDEVFESTIDTQLGMLATTLNLRSSETINVQIPLNGDLPYRDAPVSVAVDPQMAFVEQSRSNNVVTTAGLCAADREQSQCSEGGISSEPAIDLMLCLDASGSILSDDFELQMGGTAAAIADNFVLPHDGSVRLSVYQFAGEAITLVPPTVVQSCNVGNISDSVREAEREVSVPGTAFHTCVDLARSTVSGLPLTNSIQILDISTDGVTTEDEATEFAAINRAIDAGMDKINALAVSLVSGLDFLRDLTHPSNGGAGDGFVLPAIDFNAYERLIKQKIRREIRTSDLTVGGLRLIEPGYGLSPQLSFRVANAGADLSVPEVLVSLFNADPADGGQLLMSQTLPKLDPNQYLDLSFDDIQGLHGGEVLVVIVDQEQRNPECNRYNNRSTITASSPTGLVTVGSGQDRYQPHSTAIITAPVTNTGSIAGSYTLVLTIHDSLGHRVTSFDPVAIDDLAAGAGSEPKFEWATGVIYPGTYIATASLFDAYGQLASEATTSFSIGFGEVGAPIGDVRISTNRPEYHTTDTVQLTQLIQNLTLNLPLTAVASYQLTDPRGQTLVSVASDPFALEPRALHIEYDGYALTAATEGEYSLTAALHDEQGTLLASDSASFAVVENLRQALSGTVTADKSVLHRREEQSCNGLVTNSGTLSHATLSLRHALVSLGAGGVINQTSATTALAAGASATLNHAFDTDDIEAGRYACVLEAQDEGEWLPLDYAHFEILPPLVQMDAELAQGPRGRVLVLTDAQHSAQNMPATCQHQTWRAQFEADFATPWSAGATANVRLFRQGGVVDIETAELGSDGEINARTSDAPVDLSIPLFGPDTLLVELTGETLQQTLGEHYALVATIEDQTRTLALETGVIDVSCNALPALRENLDGGLQLVGLDGIAPAPSAGRYGDGQDQRGPSQQSSHVLNLLVDAGWRVRRENTAPGFVAAMRSGTYDAYLLLAEYVALTDGEVKELREAVFNGSGLISAGRFEERSRVLDPALGIAHHGTHLDATGVQLLPGPLHPGGSANLAEIDNHDDIQRVRLAGAQSQGTVISPHQAEHNTLVTTHQYGLGRTVHVGFDLLAEASIPTAPAAFDQLLLAALEHVHPDQSQARAGYTSPLALQIDNLGIATPGELTVTTTAGATFSDTTLGSIGPVDQLSWPFSFAEGESAQLDFWVQAPWDGSPYSVTATVESIDGPERFTEAAPSLSLSPAPVAGLAQAVTTLDAIIQGRQTSLIGETLGLLLPTAAEQALTHLREAEQILAASNPDHAAALAELLAATDDLIADGSADMHAPRHAVGHTLRWLEAQL